MSALALVALAALTLLTPQTGMAAMRPAGEDVFGIYANNNFNGDASDENPPYINPAGVGIEQTYIYLTNVIAPNIGAFEFALSYTGGSAPIITDQGLPPEGVNFGTGNEFFVGVGTPLVPDQYGNVILMSPQYFVSDQTPVSVFVGPVSIPHTPGEITYVEFDDVSIAHFMTPASGDFGARIFAFNETIVENEGTTWTDVKSLYR